MVPEILLTVHNQSKEKMNSKSAATRLLARFIDESGKSPKRIAAEVGFESTRDLELVMAGEAELPIGRMGSFAKSVGADPMEVFTACLNEYFPETWQSVSPFLESALTSDELSLIRGLRDAVGGPYLMSLTAVERKPLKEFLALLSQADAVH